MAAAFRRTLDAQSTTNDQTISMRAITDEPTAQTAHGEARQAPAAPMRLDRTSISTHAGRPAQAESMAMAGTAGTGIGHASAMAVVAAASTTEMPTPTLTAPVRPVAPAPLRSPAQEPGQGPVRGAVRGPAQGPAQGAQQPPVSPPTAEFGDQRPPRKPNRHSAGNRPGRLPAAVGISAVLAAIGGLALILTNSGLYPDPTAPSALPDDATSQVLVIGGGPLPGEAQSGSVRASPVASRTVPNRTPDPVATTAGGVAPTGRGTPTAVATTVTAAPTTPNPTPTSTFVPVSEGSTGTEVTQLQNQLARWGYMVRSNRSGGFGSVCISTGWDQSGNDKSQTTDAIYQFQRNDDDFNGADLEATGVCDLATWNALFRNAVYSQDCYGGV